MDSRTEQVETPVLIATRVPPGDKWKLVDDAYETVHSSLTDTLEAYFQATGFKGDYKLAPLDSKLYALHTEEIEIKQPEEKIYGLFGEFRQGV